MDKILTKKEQLEKIREGFVFDVFSPKKLKEAMLEKGYNTQDIGILSGLNAGTIYASLIARSIPGANTLMIISKILDKPISFFYEDKESVLDYIEKTKKTKQVNAEKA